MWIEAGKNDTLSSHKTGRRIPVEKNIYYQEKPKRPIGRKKHPYTTTDFEPDAKMFTHLRCKVFREEENT